MLIFKKLSWYFGTHSDGDDDVDDGDNWTL